MKSFVKNEVMQVADSASKLVKIDLPNKDNLCSYKEVDIGVGATRALSQSQVSDEDKLGFKVACEKFLSTTVTKILERSPLKYGIVRSISCLVPGTVSNNRQLAEI
jgi:hypothetical protein